MTRPGGTPADGLYYFFYSDYVGLQNKLFYRTVWDVGDHIDAKWSAAISIKDLPPETIVRVARGTGVASNRWAVMYNCNQTPGRQDICLEYSVVIDPANPTAALTSIEFTGAPELMAIFSLHLKGNASDGTASTPVQNFAQPYWMTDREGNLAVPTTNPNRGGELRWTNFCEGRHGCTNPYGGKVYRAGWDVSVQ